MPDREDHDLTPTCAARRALAPVIITLIVPLAAGPSAAAGGTVRIAAGDDARSIIGQQPAGTTFVFAAGTHRLTDAIAARSGDTFVGEYGATIKGSKLLPPAAAVAADGRYYFADQTHAPNLSPYATADLKIRDGNPLWAREVQYGNELFVDGQRQRHVNTLAEVTAPGTWYFDDAADRIYMYDSPAGRTVETSVAKQAFKVGTSSLAASNVTIDNLYVQQFANNERGNGGAIGLDNADDTLIRRVDASFNHAAGITGGAGRATVEDSRIAHNGQIGISTSRTRLTFRRNEVARNNAVHFNPIWEAGATKFAGSPGGVFEHNWVHDNTGFGFWWDIDNVGDTIRSNLVEGNADAGAGRGIFYEISGDAAGEPTRIYWNTVRDNMHAGVYVSSSSNVRVQDNAISGSFRGIQVDDANRRTLPDGSYLNNVERITITGNDVLVTAANGFQVQLTGGAYMRKSDVEALADNVYRGTNGFSLNGRMTFAEWKALWADAGFELGSTYSPSTVAGPSLPAGAVPFASSTYGPVPVPEPNVLAVAGAGAAATRFGRRTRKRGRPAR